MAFVGIAAAQANGAAESASISVAARGKGNILVAVQSSENNATNISAVGWRTIQAVDGTGGHAGAFFWRVASGDSGDDFNPTWTTVGRSASLVCEYSGIDTSQPFDVYALTDSSTVNVAGTTGLSTGSSAPRAKGVAVAMLTVDLLSNWDSTYATTQDGVTADSGFSNSVAVSDTAASRPSAHQASKVYDSASTISATWTGDSATTSKCIAAVALFVAKDDKGRRTFPGIPSSQYPIPGRYGRARLAPNVQPARGSTVVASNYFSNPATAGIWNFAEGGKQLLDGGPGDWELPASPTTLSYTGGSAGRVISQSGTGGSGDSMLVSNTPDPGFWHDATSNWLAVLRVKLTGDSTGPQCILSVGGSTRGFEVGYRNGPNTFFFNVADESVDVEIASSAITPPALVNIVASYQNGAMKLYIDGKLENTGSNGTSIAAYSDEPGLFLPGGAGGAVGTVVFEGDIAFLAITREPVPDSFARLLSENPYQILKPATPSVYSVEPRTRTYQVPGRFRPRGVFSLKKWGVNWDDPMTDALHAVWVLDRGSKGSGVRYIQLVPGGPDDLVSISSNETPSTAVGKYFGRSLHRGAMNTWGTNSGAGQENIQGSNLTMVTLGYRTAGVYQDFLTHAQTTTGGLALSVTTGDVVRFTTYNVADNDGPTISGEGGKMWFVGAVFDPNIESVEIYGRPEGGRLYKATDTATGTPTGTPDRWGHGNKNATGFGNQADAAISLVWRRKLTEAEIRKLSADPYQILKPATPTTWQIRPQYPASTDGDLAYEIPSRFIR